MNRVAHRETLTGTSRPRSRAATRAEVAARLRAANTAYGFVNDVAALARHPALRRVTIATPGGAASLAAPPVIASDGTPPFGPVPAIGAHTAAIQDEFGETAEQ